MFDHETFKQRFGLIHALTGLSAKDFGRKLGGYPAYRVSCWRNGKALPTLEDGYLIAEAFQMHVDFLCDKDREFIVPNTDTINGFLSRPDILPPQTGRNKSPGRPKKKKEEKEEKGKE